MRDISLIVTLAVSLNLGGCVAPLPIKSIADPGVRGTVKENGLPKAGLEVWMDHDGYNACTQPKTKTTTDRKGYFSFAEKNRSWTWLGWANNHFLSVCVIGPAGPRMKSISAYNEPKVISLDCDLAVQHAVSWCSYSCEGGWQNRC